MSNKRITWARWEHRDPYDSTKWTAYTVSVYEPTWERPHVTILFSKANGKGWCLDRFSSIQEIREWLIIPDKYLDRLLVAETQAIEIERQIRHDQRLLYNAKQPGRKIVDADTGEIVAEAEEIIRKGTL